MTTAIYPGSFDPITNGHIDVLKRAADIFDSVIVAVLNNTEKSYLINLEDRLELIKKSTKSLKNIKVDSFNGLTVEYAKKMNAKVLIRGLRAVSDFEYEMQMAQMNKTLDNEVETIFLMPSVEYNFLSSSTVKEVSLLGGDVSAFVPKSVKEYIIKKRKEKINEENK